MTDTTDATEQTAAATGLPKAYRPADFEAGIYERWLAADVFAPDGAGSRANDSLPPFTIIQPPPNITGSLHLGHAQRTTVEDLMIRHARMQGRPTLYLPGLDHASIAAQVVLDRIIAKDGESRASLGRERYLERMHAFVATTREVMLGCGADLRERDVDDRPVERRHARAEDGSEQRQALPVRHECSWIAPATTRVPMPRPMLPAPMIVTFIRPSPQVSETARRDLDASGRGARA